MTRGNLIGVRILAGGWFIAAHLLLTTPASVAQAPPNHRGEGVTDQAAGPYNCAVMTPVQPYSYRGAALSTIYYAPDGVNWWPSLTEIFTQARQVWLDGYWCFYPLEIQQEGGKPYGQGQPQEALGQPQLADLFGTYMSGWPGTASTWPVGADFTDTNAHFGWAPVVCDDPNDNPPSPLPAVLYANGNPVSVGDTLGTLDQTWSVVVPFDPTGIFFSGSGTVPLTGPAAIHRLVSEYEKCLRVVNMGQGPVIYPH